MSTTNDEATGLPAQVEQLDLQRVQSTPLPELVGAAREDFRQLEGQGAVLLDAEDKHRRAAEHLRVERDHEGLARKFEAIRLEAARAVAGELGPRGKGGRGQKNEAAEELGIDRKERTKYRHMAEPTDEEFDGWLLTAEVLSKRSLVSYGRKLAKTRDRETGELLGPEPPEGEPPEPPDTDEPPDLTEGLSLLGQAAHVFREAAPSSAVALEVLRKTELALAIGRYAQPPTNEDDDQEEK